MLNAKMKILVLIFSFILFQNYAQSDSYAPLNLNASLISDLLNTVFAGVLHICSDESVDSALINFWLYTRSSTTRTKLNNFAPVMETKKTIVYIPGWMCNVTSDLKFEMVDAYLTRYDANIILADWCYYAFRSYGDAYCRVPNVAKVIVDFLITLETNSTIFVKDIHVLGHSLGGQIAGLIGNYLRTSYSKLLKRITGLDPAGPLYLGNNPTDRLDKSDASFVDVIHTNAGILGYAPRCGHADYYPRCGTFQNGCLRDNINVLSVDSIINQLSCDHLRSYYYMTESVNSNKFRSAKEIMLCVPDFTEISYMGEDSILYYKDFSYVCDTNSTSPFAQG